MVEDTEQSRSRDQPPPEFPGVRSGLQPDSQLDVVPSQITEHGTGGPQLVELVEDQADDMLDLFVGILADPAPGKRT